jgi:hypothetical protein
MRVHDKPSNTYITRLRCAGQEIVVFRDDITRKLARHTVPGLIRESAQSHTPEQQVNCSWTFA